MPKSDDIAVSRAPCSRLCCRARPRFEDRGHAPPMRGHDHDQFPVETKKSINVKITDRGHGAHVAVATLDEIRQGLGGQGRR